MKRLKYEDIFYIDKYGIALDCFGNEQLSENGELILIPKRMRKHFKVIERD
jgi:hypothetical protein